MRKRMGMRKRMADACSARVTRCCTCLTLKKKNRATKLHSAMFTRRRLVVEHCAFDTEKRYDTPTTTMGPRTLYMRRPPIKKGENTVTNLHVLDISKLATLATFPAPKNDSVHKDK